MRVADTAYELDLTDPHRKFTLNVRNTLTGTIDLVAALYSRGRPLEEVSHHFPSWCYKSQNTLLSIIMVLHKCVFCPCVSVCGCMCVYFVKSVYVSLCLCSSVFQSE